MKNHHIEEILEQNISKRGYLKTKTLGTIQIEIGDFNRHAHALKYFTTETIIKSQELRQSNLSTQELLQNAHSYAFIRTEDIIDFVPLK